MNTNISINNVDSLSIERVKKPLQNKFVTQLFIRSKNGKEDMVKIELFSDLPITIDIEQ